jgi:transglutaminase-like putative cysteine protease
LSRGYGDCKDKANLMRAMLRVLKIESYPIAIYSGDPTFVREEWASPGPIQPRHYRRQSQ